MRARKNIFRKILPVLIIIVLLISNVILFKISEHYYLQLNKTRLDPLNLAVFGNPANQGENGRSDVQSVVFFGDSRAATWPSPRVEGYRFLNRGIGAQTSTQVAMRYDAHIQPLKPDVLILQICINDLKTIPLFPDNKNIITATCKNNIAQMVGKATDEGATVILSTIIPASKASLVRKYFWSDEVALAVDDVNNYILTLASENVVIFDSYAIIADESGLMSPKYRHDALHLNEVGYAALNEALVPLLVSIAPIK